MSSGTRNGLVVLLLAIAVVIHYTHSKRAADSIKQIEVEKFRKQCRAKGGDWLLGCDLQYCVTPAGAYEPGPWK